MDKFYSYTKNFDTDSPLQGASSMATENDVGLGSHDGNGVGIGLAPKSRSNLEDKCLEFDATNDGTVSVEYSDQTLKGVIPNAEWQETRKDGLDFLVSGRTGANGGNGYIESLDLKENAVCFTAGTFIETAQGLVTVEELQIGNLVTTRDHGLQPIRWIGSRKLYSKQLEAAPNLRPIRIQAGSLGKNVPDTDLTISPQHRILVRSKIAQRMLNSDEVLVSAKHLLDLDGIEIAEDVTEVEYFHILFDQHEVIFSNGAETESLHTGPEALRSLNPSARDEIFNLLPELDEKYPISFVRPSARPLVPGRVARQLARRHNKNSCDLVTLTPECGAYE